MVSTEWTRRMASSGTAFGSKTSALSTTRSASRPASIVPSVFSSRENQPLPPVYSHTASWRVICWPVLITSPRTFRPVTM